VSNPEDFHLVCDRCGLDNGDASRVRKKKLGYVPDDCSCGHSMFRLLSSDEIAERERLDERQMSLAL
jgi:hypothetical protein